MIPMENLPTDLLERIVGTHLLDIKDRVRFCLATSKTLLNRLGLSLINSLDYDTNDKEVHVLFRRHEVTLRDEQLDQYLRFCSGRHIAHAKHICIISGETPNKSCEVEHAEEDDSATTVVLKDHQDISGLLQLLMNCESGLNLRIHTLVINRTKHIEHQISFHDFVALKNLKIFGWDTTSLVLTDRKLPMDLEKLSLSNTYIATNPNDDLPIVSLPNLRSLEIRHCYCHAPINSWINSAILCRSLEKLVISSCDGTRDAFVIDDTIDASHCENLKHIEVRDLAWNPLRSLQLPVGIQHVDIRNSGIDKISMPSQGSHLEVLKLSILSVFLDDVGDRCKQLWIPAEYLFRIPAELLLRLTEIDIAVNGQQWYEYVERYVFLPLLKSDKVYLDRCTFHMNQGQMDSRSRVAVSSSREFLNLLVKVSSRWRRIRVSFEE